MDLISRLAFNVHIIEMAYNFGNIKLNAVETSSLDPEYICENKRLNIALTQVTPVRWNSGWIGGRENRPEGSRGCCLECHPNESGDQADSPASKGQLEGLREDDSRRTVEERFAWI